MYDNFLTVSTFWWTDPERERDYEIELRHVLILRNMVKRNLTMPHEFVCVCDSYDKGVALESHGIRPVPLDMSKHVPNTVFARLMLRHPHAGGWIGRRVLNLDVDICIVGNIDHIARREEENVWWLNPNFKTGASRAFIQTSVQLLTTGTLTHLWTAFDPVVTPTWVNRRFGGKEQAWVSEMLDWRYVDLFTDRNGIYGAMRLFNGQPDTGIGSLLPDNAAIVSFPGNRAPWQNSIVAEHPWLREHYR